MLEKIFKSAEDLFDRKLKNWTVMVVIISSLVTMTGFLSNTVNANLTANVLQVQKKVIQPNFIVLNGIKYEIIFKEVK